MIGVSSKHLFLFFFFPPAVAHHERSDFFRGHQGLHYDTFSYNLYTIEHKYSVK